MYWRLGTFPAYGYFDEKTLSSKDFTGYSYNDDVTDRSFKAVIVPSLPNFFDFISKNHRKKWSNMIRKQCELILEGRLCYGEYVNNKHCCVYSKIWFLQQPVVKAIIQLQAFNAGKMCYNRNKANVLESEWVVYMFKKFPKIFFNAHPVQIPSIHIEPDDFFTEIEQQQNTISVNEFIEMMDKESSQKIQTLNEILLL